MSSEKQRPEVESSGYADGVAAVDRALAILNAFRSQDRSLSLAELAARTGLYKSTMLRIIGSLIRGGMLDRLEDGRYRVGAATFRLGAIFQRSFAVADILQPIMRELSDETGENVAYYVRSGETRTCLFRVESRHAIRYTVREGDVLPLYAGSGGRVLAAFSGEPGEPYETIRRTFHHVSIGDRDAETVGISVPVFALGGTLAGALTVAGPASRVDANFIRDFRSPLLKAAARATRSFGEDPGALLAASAEVSPAV